MAEQQNGKPRTALGRLIKRWAGWVWRTVRGEHPRAMATMSGRLMYHFHHFGTIRGKKSVYDVHRLGTWCDGHADYHKFYMVTVDTMCLATAVVDTVKGVSQARYLEWLIVRFDDYLSESEAKAIRMGNADKAVELWKAFMENVVAHDGEITIAKMSVGKH